MQRRPCVMLSVLMKMAGWKWNPHPSGKFPVSSAYHDLQRLPTLSPLDSCGWKMNWSIKGSLRGNLLLWQIRRESLPTAELLFSQHIIEDDTCPICVTQAETAMYAMRDCTVVRKTWREVIPRGYWYEFISFVGIPNWLDFCLDVHMLKLDTIEFWRILFRELISSICYWRNEDVHQNGAQRPPTIVFISNTIRKAREFRLV